MAETTARDVMEPDVETVAPDDDVASVVERFAGVEFDAFPVVEGDGRLVGIVTKTDLVDLFEFDDGLTWIPIGLPPFTETLDYAVDLPWDDPEVKMDLSERADEPVRTVMTENVITVNPEHGLDHVLALLADEEIDINHLPVTDGGKLVGIIARQDVLAALRDEREATREDRD